VIEVDTGARRVLYQEPGAFASLWAWAPDSQSIAFTKYQEATGSQADGIWVVTLDGDVRQLSADYQFATSWQPVQE
jgi:hypothetical protein